MTRKNGKIIRRMAMDELDLTPNTTEYKAAWAKVGRKVEKLDDHLYREFDNQIEDLRKNVKLFVKFSI